MAKYTLRRKQSRSPKKHSSVGTDGLAALLIAEYENMHNRVFQQMASYESANVKMLMLYGVLLWFSISYYDKVDISYLQLFVDMIFFVLFPVLLGCAVALTVANMGKIMILGDYLMIIENKINKAFSAEAERFGFHQEHFEYVLGWEYWRLKCGNNKKGNGFTEATLSVAIILLEVLVTVFCAGIRMHYLRESLPANCPRAWLMLGVSLLFLAVICVWGLRQYLKRHGKATERAELFYNPEGKPFSDLPECSEPEQ